MTAERSGEAELTLLPVLYVPEQQQLLEVCAAFVKEVFLDDTRDREELFLRLHFDRGN
jgi:hypothetical protein